MYNKCFELFTVYFYGAMPQDLSEDNKKDISTIFILWVTAMFFIAAVAAIKFISWLL